MIGYKAKAIELLNEHIERIKANAPEMVSVHLAMPSDHSDEYDRVIEMLLWSQDDQLELTDIEFSEEFPQLFRPLTDLCPELFKNQLMDTR